MKFFSKITEYAIRALIVLARERYWRMDVKRICKEENLPIPFTRKALQILKRHKILTAIRGPKGGYMLKKMPEKIFLYDLIKIFDNFEKTNQCTLGSNHCLSKDPCVLRLLNNKCNKIFLKNIKLISIADLL